MHQRKKRAVCQNSIYWLDCEVGAIALGATACTNDFMLDKCCEFCIAFRTPTGCGGNLLDNLVCKQTVDAEGTSFCNDPLTQPLCCLQCAIVAVRPSYVTVPTTVATTTATTLTTPTTPVTTVSTGELVCAQVYNNDTCVKLLLADAGNCSTPFFLARCCNLCPKTTTTSETRTITITTTATTQMTASPTPMRDPFPTCNNMNTANTAICVQYSYMCYDSVVEKACCETCTSVYYDRKANGYDVDFCAYGNRDESSCSSTVNCANPVVARLCCGVCYPKQNVTVRPVVYPSVNYTILLNVVSENCSVELRNMSSATYQMFYTKLRATLMYIFAFLPGEQIFTIAPISCTFPNPVLSTVTMNTPSTHTYSELYAIYMKALSDLPATAVQVSEMNSSLKPAELAASYCSANIATNCDTITAQPGACYQASVLRECCYNCQALSQMLYQNRTYIPQACLYGNRISCAAPNCSSAVSKQECCFTCAVPSQVYTTPLPTTIVMQTTTTFMVPTTSVTITSPAPSTTTRQPCLRDISGADLCQMFTKEPSSCYTDNVYNQCCKTCDSLRRWDLPSSCAWGNLLLAACSSVTSAQCNSTTFSASCCEKCGPHFTSAAPSTTTVTTVAATTTVACTDSADNCADLTSNPYDCYALEEQCCASCRARTISYLPYQCRFGDQFALCYGLTRANCNQTINATNCCALCGPLAPTTITQMTQTTSTARTTMQAAVSTTAHNVSVKPACSEDVNSTVCPFLTQSGGCYNAGTEAACCLSCQRKLVPGATEYCRFGDHADYCSSVSRQRCLTEVRVATDCCKTCENITAPPGVCINTAPNCDSLTNDLLICYSDTIYSLCCQSCEQKAYVRPTCRWGDANIFCRAFNRSFCALPDASVQCCDLCKPANITQEITTPQPTVPQCIDQSGCSEDTKEQRYCYEEGVERACCASCGLIRYTKNNTQCPYGDKAALCSLLQPQQCYQDPLLEDTCCERCAMLRTTTTLAPVTSACYDTSNCTSAPSECYNDKYRSMCCATCQQQMNSGLTANCLYGDKQHFCSIFTAEQCRNYSLLQEECCKTCVDLLSTTTTVMTTTTVSTAIQSSTTTQKMSTTNGSSLATTSAATASTTTLAACRDKKNCTSLPSSACYNDTARDLCCVTCLSRSLGNTPSCLYGDRDPQLCALNFNCSLAVVADRCCQRCAGFIVQATVIATYRLRVNVTSRTCITAFLDHQSEAFVALKGQVEAPLVELFIQIPGSQNVSMTDISCGSVIAVLDLTSRGFYSLKQFEKYIMGALQSNVLGVLAVSPIGSSLQAVSFQPPQCNSVDQFPTAVCLSQYIYAKPSRCYDSAILVSCCESCSSLFYDRLAAGKDVLVAPYGDGSVDCFTSFNCSRSDAKQSCPDLCSSSLTTALPMMTTATPTTTPVVTMVTTTVQCVDQNTTSCKLLTSNSRSYCYDDLGSCCATCQSLASSSLPDNCHWGNKRAYCASLNISYCVSAEFNSTCCELCGPHKDVIPSSTAAPCTVDVAGSSCSLAAAAPGACYLQSIFSQCCVSCNRQRSTSLPSQCPWGDMVDWCDSSLCGTQPVKCCGTCASPSTTTSTPSTTSFTSTAVTYSQVTTVAVTLTTSKISGCQGIESTNCRLLVTNASACYDPQISQLCCDTCYSLRRLDLPATCPYGNKASCAVSQVSRLNCYNRTDVVSDCCESCSGLILNCNGLSVATNCEDKRLVVGACYSKDVRDNCCPLCRSLADYTAPDFCLYGDKAAFCKDLNATMSCLNSDNQNLCCKTCAAYIGFTAATTVSTTPITPSTRLPPNEACPQGDNATNCAERTKLLGACYDPAVNRVCCRTCYLSYRADLPSNCQFGDKSEFCRSVDAASVDATWCQVNGDTCCDRCSSYRSTTVPSTTVPMQCPSGNKASNCSLMVRYGRDCYSQYIKDQCCVPCHSLQRIDLPQSCLYGDKAAYCSEIHQDECSLEKSTCCAKCSDWLTTTTPTAMTSASRRTDVEIGSGLFKRPAPPVDQFLFSVTMKRNTPAGCNLTMDNITLENQLCTSMGQVVQALTHCVLQTLTCTNGVITSQTAVLINGSAQTGNVKAAVLRQLANYQEMLVSPIVVTDVNECSTTDPILSHGCRSPASCQNSDGLYTCSCPTAYRSYGAYCLYTPSVAIGKDVFSRSAPPGDELLYKVILPLDSTNGNNYSCINAVWINQEQTSEFRSAEQEICSALWRTFWSLYKCYVEDFNCDQEFIVSANVIIKGSWNYPVMNSQPSVQKLTEELGAYPGKMHGKPYVLDINECSTPSILLKSRCNTNLNCTNTEGLYNCTCPLGYTGDGFTCALSSAQSMQSSDQFQEWAIALIAVAAVLFVAAIVVAIIMSCRKCRRSNRDRISSTGSDTPPRAPVLPALYNSIRSSKTTHSDVGSYFFAPQERELASYTYKNYADRDSAMLSIE